MCGGDGSDSVYRFIAPIDGTIGVSLVPNGIRGTLYVMESSCGAATTLVCETPGSIDAPSSGTFAATACTTYYVFADQDIGVLDGTFTLNVQYQ